LVTPNSNPYSRCPAVSSANNTERLEKAPALGGRDISGSGQGSGEPLDLVPVEKSTEAVFHGLDPTLLDCGVESRAAHVQDAASFLNAEKNSTHWPPIGYG